MYMWHNQQLGQRLTFTALMKAYIALKLEIKTYL